MSDMQTVLNGADLHALFISGYHNLKKNMEAINELNVFPVPDGDTGVNMVMTLGGGIHAATGDVQHVGNYMQKFSRDVLLSARGNSGVIFSQFFCGLSRGMAGKETVSFADMAEAFRCATEDAYSAIMTPTEGTILTVIREAAEFLAAEGEQDVSLLQGFERLLQKMTATLKKTPELLPVLKEAGVVDSGGAGLVCFMEGVYAGLCGETVADVPEIGDVITAPANTANFGPDSELEYGYCTEFILQLMHRKTDIAAFDLQQFTKPLEEMGDSIVSVHSDGIVKIHIHTFTPELVLGYGRQFGEFVNVKVENMSVQHSQTQATAPTKEKVKYAVIAVAAGEGIKAYFSEIGASYIIDGGQTNNPSVNDFLEAFDRFDAEHIVVLPNNSNIVLTANQAAETYTACDVRVIPTHSVAEGYSALSMMNLWCDTVDELVEDMSASLGNVITGYVTTAVRDSQMDGLDIKKGMYIGLAGKHILAAENDRVTAATTMISKTMAATPKDVAIVFCGEGISEQEVAQISSFLNENYPLMDVGFIEGKQPVYDFIISLE